jgi:metallothionein
MDRKSKKCAHPACTCMVEKDNKYCSQYCQDAGGTMEISCNCGHAGCSVSESEPTMTAGG